MIPGRRAFVDVAENFPEACRSVIESLRQVYRFDAQAKEQKLSEAVSGRSKGTGSGRKWVPFGVNQDLSP